MFNFLSAEKRAILLEYPFARDFAEGKIKLDRFLDNLHAFEADLKQRGFTDPEIKELAGIQKETKPNMTTPSSQTESQEPDLKANARYGRAGAKPHIKLIGIIKQIIDTFAQIENRTDVLQKEVFGKLCGENAEFGGEHIRVKYGMPVDASDEQRQAVLEHFKQDELPRLMKPLIDHHKKFCSFLRKMWKQFEGFEEYHQDPFFDESIRAVLAHIKAMIPYVHSANLRKELSDRLKISVAKDKWVISGRPRFAEDIYRGRRSTLLYECGRTDCSAFKEWFSRILALENMEEDFIKHVKSKIIDFHSMENKISVHNTTLAGLEVVLAQLGTDSLTHVWVYGCTKSSYVSSGPFAHNFKRSLVHDISRPNPYNMKDFDLGMALEVQKFIFDIYKDKRKSRKFSSGVFRFVSEPELEYLKVHPVDSNISLEEQDESTLSILKHAAELIMENDYMFRFYEVGVIFDVVPRREGDDHIFPGRTNVIGLVIYHDKKHLLPMVKKIMFDLFKDNIQLCVPIYDHNEKVLWPK